MADPEVSLDSSIAPYDIKVASTRLDDIRERVRAFRWDAWSEPADAGDWRYGPPSSFMRGLCDYWLNKYDWRGQENAINALPQFITQIDDVRIHFIHERGSGPNPAPLLIAHGWPYSFHSYAGLIDRLAHPERHGERVKDAFSVVIPSYPGYDFQAARLNQWDLSPLPFCSTS